MKKRTFKSVINSLFVIALFGLVITSCNNEDPINEDPSVSLEASAFSQAEIDDISEGVNDITENVFFDIENQSKSKIELSKSSSVLKFLPDCVTITKVITGDSKNVIIDYGEGCAMRNENILSGKIILDITFNLGELKATVNSSFDNFYFNGKKVEGTIIKSHTISSGIPEANISTDIKIIWEDESFVNVTGERKRIWIDGFSNMDFGDNVFLVSGSWTVTKKDGTARVVTTMEPLRREMSCRYIVSGIVKIEQDDKEITVDYGNGECNDLANAIINGNEFEFHIGQKRKKKGI